MPEKADVLQAAFWDFCPLIRAGDELHRNTFRGATAEGNDFAELIGTSLVDRKEGTHHAKNQSESRCE